jgi:hypothetical protein
MWQYYQAHEYATAHGNLLFTHNLPADNIYQVGFLIFPELQPLPMHMLQAWIN